MNKQHALCPARSIIGLIALKGFIMIAILTHSVESAEKNAVVKLPYQAPQLIFISSPDVENNEGFASDAGLDVGAS